MKTYLALITIFGILFLYFAKRKPITKYGYIYRFNSQLGNMHTNIAPAIKIKNFNIAWEVLYVSIAITRLEDNTLHKNHSEKRFPNHAPSSTEPKVCLDTTIVK